MTAHANENGSAYFNVGSHLSLHLLLEDIDEYR